MTNATELQVCSLDVWGNEDDGFDVNATYATGVTVLPDMDDDYYYRQVREHFPHLPAFRIEWLDEHLADVTEAKTGKPLFVIQLH
jgi:hypothetical protein